MSVILAQVLNWLFWLLPVVLILFLALGIVRLLFTDFTEESRGSGRTASGENPTNGGNEVNDEQSGSRPHSNCLGAARRSWRSPVRERFGSGCGAAFGRAHDCHQVTNLWLLR